MGMAASQVRFLSLQNRKNTVGLNLMTLSNRKLALSRDMNRIANEYNDAMNLKTLKWSSDSGVTYNDLSYDMLMKPNDLNATLPYIVTDANGRVVVDDSNISFDGFTSDYSYRDLATLISTYSGTDSKTNLPIYDNVGNVNGPVDSAISGNASLPGCEYTNVSDVNQYDIKGNSLRYDLLSKLGVISEEDYESFLAASANVSGNAIGESFTNWDDVLDKYIKDGGMTNTGSPVTLGLSDKDGNVEDVSSSTYFGTWDPTKNTFVGGCAKGNLAVAKYELEQYQNWCGELHKAKLSETTTHSFTGISGIELQQETQPIIDDLNAFGASDLSSMFSSNSTAQNTGSWSSIYNNNSGLLISGWTGDQFLSLLANFGSSLSNSLEEAGNAGAADNIDGWSFVNQIADDEITIKDVNDAGEQYELTTDLADAARKWAFQQTVSFYNANSAVSVGKTKHPDETAKNEMNNHNTAVYCKKKKTAWGWIVTALAAVAGVVGGIFTGGATAIIALGAWAGMAGAAGASAGDGFSTTGGKQTAFGLQNFMKTYFTFYQMYIDANGDTDAIMQASQGLSTSQKVHDTSVIDSIAGVEADSGKKSSLYKNNSEVFIDPTSGKTYFTGTTIEQISSEYSLYKAPDGSMYQAKNLTFDSDGDGSLDQTVQSKNVYVDKQGNKVTSQINDDGSSLLVYEANGSSTLIDSNGSATSYKKIEISITPEGDETYKYYDASGAETASPQKDVYSSALQYNGLKVTSDLGNTTFTDAISVYLTPTQKNLQILNDRITQAEKALADANAGVESVYSEKEKRLMAYFDAIFKMISSNGWVYDESVNSDDKTASKNYLNAKLQNNMYFITEVETVDGSEYNYATKLASNVSKIFEVYDKDAQNAALSKYEAEKAEINSKEKQIDIRMNKLEAEQDAISTELDSIKKIIDDNVSTTFKIFT